MGGPDPLSASKPAGYYGQGRANLIAELPRPLGRVLDVGCGEGGAGTLLRTAGATEVTGIVIEPGPAAVAAQRYDRVEVGDARRALARLTARLTRCSAATSSSTSSSPAPSYGSSARPIRRTARCTSPRPTHAIGRSCVISWSEARLPTPRGATAMPPTCAGWHVEGTTRSLAHFLRARRLPAPHGLVWRAGELFAVQWFVLARADR